MDPRYQQLAEVLVGYSTKVKPGDKVLVHTFVETPPEMVRAIFEAVRRSGGVNLEPILQDQRLMAACLIGTNEAALAVDSEAHLVRVKGCDVWIALRSRGNMFEMSAAPSEAIQLYAKAMEPSIQLRANHRRWVLTGWPTRAFAQLSGLSTPACEDFFFQATLADYPAMAEAVRPLEDLMQRTDQVKVVGPGTELSFSIKDIPVIPCVGERNIPDGECFTAPVRESMNGVIQYNTLSITKSGERFEGIRFAVQNGRIIDASARTGDSARLQSILGTDTGARYFGEFSFGLNWGVTQIIGDSLFDEKVGGTLHLTPGNAYQSAPNGNVSAVHWDLVLDQRASAGGGEVWFDGELIRQDGIFTLPELAGLNPPQ